MPARWSVATSLRLAALAASLATPLACSSSAIGGAGGSGGGTGGVAGTQAGGAAGGQAGGGAGGYAGAAGMAGGAGVAGMGGGEATAMQYGQADYPSSTDPGPADRGANLFIGGYEDALSALTQTVDVSSDASRIDTGTLTTTLSGYFGGYSSQDDNAVLTATFQDGAGQTLGTPVTIGGVTAADRNNVTGLLPRSQQTPIPVGTRRILVVLTMTRTDGNANDGYADDLSLTINFGL